MPTYLKLTDEIVADFKVRVKALDLKTIEKIRKAKDENGSFDVIISTEAKDRAGEIVRQNGWNLTNYKNNPIVLWGHDYYSLPIGVCTDTYNTEYRGVPALGARGVFLSADINPFAQQVRRMYEYGVKSGSNVGCTTSVGFIPQEFDPDDKSIITRQELLEFSFVPVPAQAGVGPASGRTFTFDEAKGLGLNLVELRAKGMSFVETLGYVPKNISDKKAAATLAWSKPNLSDFTDKTWDDLSDADKREIAGHYAWSKNNPADGFGDLKLPHHRAEDGAAVWNGVKAAMGALMGARGGVDVEGDRKAVYSHLAAHYRQFGEEPPEFKTLKEAQPGDDCTNEDGSPGILTSDPKDPDGALVCLPQDQDKSVETAHASQKALLRTLGEEHDRHVSEVEKSFDGFQKDAGKDRDQSEDDEEDDKKSKKGKSDLMREHLKDLRDSLHDEHTMHRAKSIAAFRSFDPVEDKAFDKNPYLKSLRDAHDGYEGKNNKSLDKFEEKCMKSVQGIPDEVDDHTDWITGKMEENDQLHKKAVVKIAKSMCKAAFGEEDQADEKTLEILNEYLAPHIEAQLLPAVAAKIGARISSATKEKLSEAHQHMKAATAIVEALHGGLGDDDGEEGRSGSDDKSGTTVPQRQRSRPAGDTSANDELESHMFTREVLRGVTTAATSALEKINKDLKERQRK